MKLELLCAAAMAFAMSCGSAPQDRCEGTDFPNCVYVGPNPRIHGVNPATGNCELMCNCEDWPPCPDGGSEGGMADGG